MVLLKIMLDINEEECDRGYCIEKDNFVFYYASRVVTFSSPIQKNAADMKEVVRFA